MQSLIIIGEKEKTKEKILEIALENKISNFDIEILETEKALGIPDVRNLQKKIYLTPVKGDKKIIAIEAFFGATIEAQNALLKVFEEPPATTIMIIAAKSIDFLLPTIISRCTLIMLFGKKSLTEKENEEYIQILKQITRSKTAKGFLYAQNFGKSREEALGFLENLVLSARFMIDNDDKDLNQTKLRKILKQIQKYHNLIKTTNVNVRFALENLFLDF